MTTTNEQEQSRAYILAGLFTLSLRLVVGWTYFSAFWRRLVLENKLIPDSAGYIGEKFNHFLPNSIGIRPVIEYLVSTPDMLWWAMVIFTLVEGIVGLLYMLGFFTRLMRIQSGHRHSPGVRMVGNHLSGRMADRYSGCSRQFHHLPFRRRKVLGRPSDRAEILFKEESSLAVMADFRRIACKRQAICQCQRGRCHRYLHTEPIYQPRVPQWRLGPPS